MERNRLETLTVDISELPERWRELLDGVARGRTRVVLEREGSPVAAIISANEAASFESYRAKREKDFAVLDRIGDAFKDVPLEELEAEVSQAVAEAREELWRERQSRGGE